MQLRRKSGERYGKPVQIPTFDSPLNHGWTKLRVSDVDGCVIFGLDGIAEMKHSLDFDGLWIINVYSDGEWHGSTSEQPLAELTASVRADAMPGNYLDFIDEPIPFKDETATPSEDYGLMGTR